MTHKHNLLLIISFINGAGLMIFELVAARLLAPTIGSSTYIWTSVIGIIIAMLALGSWIGGRVADKRAKSIDVAIVLLLTALTISFVVAFYEPALIYIMNLKLDPRLAGVLASLLLFAPTSFLVGFNGPYLAKLNIKSLESSGRSIANLDSLHSLGGIIGTFLTGFVLFSFIGSRAILVMLVFIFVAISWLLVPYKQSKLRLIISILALSLALAANLSAKALYVDTPSARYVITDTHQSSKNPQNLRLLITGPGGYQSGISTANPNELVFWYPQVITSTIEKLPSRDNILILGGGAYTIPRHLANQYPSSIIDVVEIDPLLPEISSEHFYYSKPKNVNHIATDARTHINTTNKQYDIIVVDVYSDSDVPFTLLTKEYGTSLKKAVTPNGVVLANIIADDQPGGCQDFFKASLVPYADNFKNGLYIKHGEGISNLIAAFTNNPNLKFNDFKPIPNLADSPKYSDDFTPAEKLQFSCK